MKYDFTTIMDRHGMDAIAVDGLSEDGQGSPAKPKEGFDIIPMWVADMNFATVPTVQEAIAERVKHPAFGYFDPREEYFQEIIDWQTKRNSKHTTTVCHDLSVFLCGSCVEYIVTFFFFECIQSFDREAFLIRYRIPVRCQNDA